MSSEKAVAGSYEPVSISDSFHIATSNTEKFNHALTPTLTQEESVKQVEPSSAVAVTIVAEDLTAVNSEYDSDDNASNAPGDLEKQQPVEEPATPPDGGLGWLVVASSFVAVFCSYGFLNSYGVYAEFYKNNLYKDTPAAVIALIGTLQITFLSAAGPFASPLSSLVGGFKIVIAMGGVIMGLGMIIASFAKSIAMLIIFQGIVVGIGSGLCVTLCVSVPASWFTKRRGLAIGIVWSGSGLGGVAFAPMTRKLMSTVGVEWALRISGILGAVAIVTVGLLGIRVWNPSGKSKQQQQQAAKRPKVFDIALLRDSKMQLYMLYSMLFFAALFLPFYYLPLFATRNGYTASQGATLALLANLGSGIGRIAGGQIGDRIGQFNTLIVSIAVCLISTLVLWLPFATIGPASAYAVIYGFASGAQVTSFTASMSHVFGVERMPSVFGMILFAGAFGILPSAPGAGQILESLGHGTNFKPLIIYMSIVYAFELVSPILIRLSYSKLLKYKV